MMGRPRGPLWILLSAVAPAMKASIIRGELLAESRAGQTLAAPGARHLTQSLGHSVKRHRRSVTRYAESATADRVQRSSGGGAGLHLNDKRSVFSLTGRYSVGVTNVFKETGIKTQTWEILVRYGVRFGYGE